MLSQKQNQRDCGSKSRHILAWTCTKLQASVLANPLNLSSHGIKYHGAGQTVEIVSSVQTLLTILPQDAFQSKMSVIRGLPAGPQAFFIRTGRESHSAGATQESGAPAAQQSLGSAGGEACSSHGPEPERPIAFAPRELQA